jgi:hypothetical protein
MSMSANVAEAIKILRTAETELTSAVNLGYTTAVVIPGPVPAPEETTIIALRATGIPGPIAIKAVLMNGDKYMAWRAAWEVLMAFAGWWGRQARWPLGDGERAKKDPTTAAGMPPLGAGLAALSATLTAITAPTWKPSVRLGGFIALFLLGAGAWEYYRGR